MKKNQTGLLNWVWKLMSSHINVENKTSKFSKTSETKKDAA